ncbi:nucleoside triphosphate pyrophosphohydrolase [Halobacterium zhouii]|uniref:nucleoside triphosphate pyrophosphohydrolase n=1 Tax=Halobacterium zhouii TaxID=2902624 RepID=UPI001E46DD9A|nr:nucleoside triphosphate pyrophosphohydrolase [Halobacterium zhouii]
MAREYDKLVRDRIPEVVREDGETPVVREVSGEEYRDYLAAKLVEEAEEYAESRDVDELADVLEVVDAIAATHDVGAGELPQRQAAKASKRGRFEDGVVLERVEEDSEDTETSGQDADTERQRLEE